MKPRLLLDVDGVLNAVTRLALPGYSTGKANGYQIQWDPTVVEFIIGLSETVDVLWLTTWEAMANEFISPLLGLPQFEVASEAFHRKGKPSSYGGNGWWKLYVAQDLWEEDPRPFVWLDDDIQGDRAVSEWLDTLPPESHLAIAPFSNEGLSHRDLEDISWFIELQKGKS